MEIRRPANADQRKLRSMWESGDDHDEAKLSGMQTDEQECFLHVLLQLHKGTSNNEQTSQQICGW